MLLSRYEVLTIDIRISFAYFYISHYNRFYLIISQPIAGNHYINITEYTMIQDTKRKQNDANQNVHKINENKKHFI